MTTYAKIRLYIDATNNNDKYDTLASVQIRGSVGGADLCTGGTPAASSSFSGFPVSNLFDGNAATQWIHDGGLGQAYPHYVEYAFASPVDVSAGEIVIVTHDSSDGGNRAPTQITIKGSNDNWSSSTTLGVWYLNVIGFNQTRYYRIIDPAATDPMFFRFRTTSTADGTYVACAELELRAETGGANLATTAVLSATSVLSAMYPDYQGNKANNASTADYWHSNALPASLVVQMAVATPYLGEAKWRAPNDSNYQRSPSAMVIESSMDGNPAGTWTEVWPEASIAAWTQGSQKTFTNPNPAPPVPTTVNVSPSTASIAVDATQAFTAEVLDQYDDAMTGQTITWASDDEGVATVDTDGVATGVAEGTCTITATCEGVNDTASLEVTAPAGGSGRIAPMRLGVGLSL